MLPPADEIVDLSGEPVLLDQGHEASRRVQEEGVEGDGSLLFPDDPARLAADGGEPGGDLLAVADGRRQKQQVDPDGEVDHDLLPDDPPVPVPQEMGLVEDDQVAVQVFPAVHGVVELIPEDLGGSDDDRGVGVFLRVPGHDADIGRIEVLPEFDPFGIGQGLQGGGVPAASPVEEDGADRLFGDPGLSGTGGGHDKTVTQPDRFEGV